MPNPFDGGARGCSLSHRRVLPIVSSRRNLGQDQPFLQKNSN